MTEDEARFILYKASAAYPNQIELEEETVAVWIERLASLPFEQGVNNLNRHIDSNGFFPKISNIINSGNSNDYDRSKKETQEYLQGRAERQRLAIACPPHIKKLLLKVGDTE